MSTDVSSANVNVFTGGCLCASVRYEARAEHGDGYYCHCRMCQLAFGNTRAAFINLRKQDVTWRSPPSYYASSKFARRGFCARCGTPLSFEYLDSERMDLAIGSLDHPEVTSPTSHFAVETRIASWHVADGLPEKRSEEHQALMQRWQTSYGQDVQPGIDAVRSEAERGGQG